MSYRNPSTLNARAPAFEPTPIVHLPVNRHYQAMTHTPGLMNAARLREEMRLTSEAIARVRAEMDLFNNEASTRKSPEQDEAKLDYYQGERALTDEAIQRGVSEATLFNPSAPPQIVKGWKRAVRLAHKKAKHAYTADAISHIRSEDALFVDPGYVRVKLPFSEEVSLMLCM